MRTTEANINFLESVCRLGGSLCLIASCVAEGCTLDGAFDGLNDCFDRIGDFIYLIAIKCFVEIVLRHVLPVDAVGGSRLVT